MKTKHPRTFHLPWSEGVNSDDKVLKSVEQFEGHRIVVTEKRDGECTSLYRDGTVHARSVTGTNHPWQAPIKSLWREHCLDLPVGWRIVGENLYAQHSIRYENLTDWFEVFAIFDEKDIALSWEETVEWSELLGLQTVPVLWQGFWDRDQIQMIQYRLNLETQEGYVLRVADKLHSSNWCHCVGKWVRKGHVQTDQNWSNTWEPNVKV